MKIEIGGKYYSPAGAKSTFVHVLEEWEAGLLKLKYSEDSWGCRLMAASQIKEQFPLDQHQAGGGQGKWQRPA